MATSRLVCLFLNTSLFAISYFATTNPVNAAMSENMQELDDAHCCQRDRLDGDECSAACKPVSLVSNALAVVPYDESLISDFHRSERVFQFGDKLIAIEQNWKDVGVAAVVWDAAIVLCEHLNLHAELVKGKTVIELGAGTGLVGIVVSQLGGDVTITDRAVALDNVRNNVVRNDVSARVAELTWGQDLDRFPDTFDVVLGADVIYIEETFSDLLRTVDHVANGSTLVIIACRVRYERDDRFLKMFRQVFTVETAFYDNHRDVRILYGRKL